MYGRLTDMHHPRSYTIKTPRSTICRNRIHIRRATTPASTPTLTSPQHLPSPRHSPLHRHSSQGSEPTTSTDQSHQSTLPSPNTNNCALDPPTSMPHPNDTSTPGESQSEPSTPTFPVPNQDQAQDHQPLSESADKNHQPPIRFKDYELK